ncbi:MAG: hypothetical protein ACXAC8_07985 [Candidatus Hodarchaeales archaeon]|jgi:hypothetical protein
MESENADYFPEYLSRLEENVLSELSAREKNYTFRFNGLRRLLRDVHQQKLSRALERLQEDQLIERFPDGGYGLDPGSYEVVKERFGKQSLLPNFFDIHSSDKKIVTTIPSERRLPVKDITTSLSGKYFGDYRFMGHYFSKGEGRLEWINAEDHSKILITSITSSLIKIEAYNVSKIALNKFLRIIQEILVDKQIILKFTNNVASQAN